MKEGNLPLVTVLMTCYNREKYIGFAIESVLVSSYTNFELIIVDDCSQDDTVKIARGFEAKDKRMKVYVNEKNVGDYPNRNFAASLASGKYLKYVDSDDYIYPMGLQVLVEAMEAFPTAGLGICTLKQAVNRPFPFILSPIEAYEYHFFGPGLFNKGPLDAIFVTIAFKQMGGFSPRRMISDSDMWHRMALYYPVVLLQEGIVWQRIHPEQELASQQKYIYSAEKIKWKYLKDPACKLLPAQLKQIKRQRLKRYLGFILAGVRRLNFVQVKTFMKCLWFVSRVNIQQ